MRVAVLSDTHGNAYALQAVLDEVRTAAPDAIINLGDQVEGAADPARAYALQRALSAVEVRGNNEEKWWPDGRRTPLSQAVGEWLRTQLAQSDIERLAELPLTARVGDILACHGTPSSAWESLLWEWQGGAVGSSAVGGNTVGEGGFYRSRDPRRLRNMLEPLGAQVVVCGHTHRAGATRVGDTLVVNCGSVSDQVDGDPCARWTLLERRGGHWSVDFRRVPYDVEAAVIWAQQHSPFGEATAEFLQSGEMTGRGVLPQV